MVKGGVRRVHLHLGEEGDHRPVQTPAEELLPQGVLEVVANVALGHGGTHRQGCHGVVGVGAGESGHGGADEADLGSAAVDQHHLVAPLDEPGEHSGGLLRRPALLRQGLPQRVAPDGGHDPSAHGCLPLSTVVLTPIIPRPAALSMFFRRRPKFDLSP